jgi:hypothetical protein
MNRGRKPLPARLHALHGNPGKRALRRVSKEISPPLGLPPADWSADKQAIWNEIADMIPFNVAVEADRIVVEMLVRLVAQIRAEPDKLNPARAAQVRCYCSELALTPAARARFEIGADTKPKSKFDGLLRGEV